MRKFVYEQELPLRWRDMDAFGHVNNSVYFTYFEQARVQWWLQLGWLSNRELDEGPVIITANATFLRAIVYPENMTIKLYTHSVGRSSYIIDYELLVQDSIVTRGETKVVWIDYKKEKSLPLPETMKQVLLQGSN